MPDSWSEEVSYEHDETDACTLCGAGHEVDLAPYAFLVEHKCKHGKRHEVHVHVTCFIAAMMAADQIDFFDGDDTILGVCGGRMPADLSPEQASAATVRIRDAGEAGKRAAEFLFNDGTGDGNLVAHLASVYGQEKVDAAIRAAFDRITARMKARFNYKQPPGMHN